MKTEKLIQLAAVALLLCSAAAGCSKKPQNTTMLHGQRPGMIGDPTSGLMDPTTPISSSEGIPASNRDFDNTTADRDAFRDQTVYFALDQATIRSSEIPKLEQVASQMRSSHAGKLLRIEGHCDERGTEEYNRSLGERRAASVREALQRLGLDASIIQTITFGEERPQIPGHDESAWSKNRRGELILLTPTTATAQGGTQ
ncbi:MAG TPA: OmpA family protein [Verrucomicrobiae bacterium]|nr:OmpA family protein [Verrucomicrobiae bacterium]